MMQAWRGTWLCGGASLYWWAAIWPPATPGAIVCFLLPGELLNATCVDHLSNAVQVVSKQSDAGQE